MVEHITCARLIQITLSMGTPVPDTATENAPKELSIDDILSKLPFSMGVPEPDTETAKINTAQSEIVSLIGKDGETTNRFTACSKDRGFFVFEIDLFMTIADANRELGVLGVDGYEERVAEAVNRATQAFQKAIEGEKADHLVALFTSQTLNSGASRAFFTKAASIHEQQISRERNHRSKMRISRMEMTEAYGPGNSYCPKISKFDL